MSRAMTSADWLDALDRSRGLPAALRGCALLDEVLGTAHGAACFLPLGRRDECLLDLQQALFGPQLHAVTRCPRCAEPLELDLLVDDLRAPRPSTSDARVALDCEGYQLSGRLPDSTDLAAAAQATDLEDARALLTQRCVVDACRNGDAVPLDAVPASVIAQLGLALSAADPQAETDLALQCPACRHVWAEAFDIASYVVDSLSHWGERCLDQVHTLARAYGWSEAQILALSPTRRAHYLARVLS